MFSRDELLKLDLYLNRPAKELIFVTRSEHLKIHCETCVKGGKIVGKIQGKKNAESGWIASLGKINGKINGKKSAKSIFQYTKSGEFVREWESASEVQRQTGIKRSSISRCCRDGLKSAGGFVWSFK